MLIRSLRRQSRLHIVKLKSIRSLRCGRMSWWKRWTLFKNNTWELTELPKEKKAIGCKWVFAKKQGSLDNDILCYKARLVAKDYTQREDIDYNEVFSPIVKQSSIQILLALVAQYKLERDQLDVKTAFLYGDIDEDILCLNLRRSRLQEKRIWCTNRGNRFMG